ncbi:hypothetical protein CF327_g7739, partial [Tilletia walkeri]
KCVRLEWRTLDKHEQTFFAFVRLYNEEDAERKSSAQRSVDAMAMAAIRPILKIKGAAKMARGGKPGSSRGKGKGKSYPSPSPSTSRATAGGSASSPSLGGKRRLCYGCGERDHLRPDYPVASQHGPGEIICWNCHQPGHSQTECRKPRRTSSGKGKGHSAAAYAAYPDADAMLGAFFEPSTDILAASSSSTLVPFMVDSGASQHIVDRADVLINARTIDKPLSFKTVGSKQVSDQVGDVTGLLVSGRRITFQGVVLLPGAGVNLLSEELLRERGWIKVVESDDTAFLQHRDHPSWRMPLTKRGRARWLMLQVEPSATSAPATSHLAPAQDVKSSPALDIHVRLGHLAFSTIKKLVKSGHLPSVPGLMEDKPWCDSCEATKATRRPFNDSPLSATAPGEIIVTDVAGPLVACFGVRKGRTSALSADFRDFRASVRQKSADFPPPVEEVRATEVSGRTANGRCPGHARLGRRRAPVRTPSGGRGRRTQLRENRRTSGGLPGLRHIAIQDLKLQGHAGSPRLMESETTESRVSYHVIVSLRES